MQTAEGWQDSTWWNMQQLFAGVKGKNQDHFHHWGTSLFLFMACLHLYIWYMLSWFLTNLKQIAWLIIRFQSI